jgi:hypothetical protein
MRKTGNKSLNATLGISLGCKGYVQRTLRKEKNWERDVLIWRTLATHPKGLSTPIFCFDGAAAPVGR